MLFYTSGELEPLDWELCGGFRPINAFYEGYVGNTKTIKMTKKREKRYIDLFNRLSEQGVDQKIIKLLRMYFGYERNGKSYSKKELAKYWQTTEDVITTIIMEHVK